MDGTGARLLETKQVVFTLTNRGDGPLTIHKVSSRCDCVQLARLKDRVLAAGESCELPVQVAVPEAGIRKEPLHVHHDGSPVPLELTVEMVGRVELARTEGARYLAQRWMDMDATLG